MKKLFYKGHFYKLITDDKKAEEIVQKMNKTPKPAHIEIGGEMLKTVHLEILSDDAMEHEDKQNAKTEKFRENIQNWENEWKQKVSALSPQEKAENVYGYFSAYWYAYTMSKDVPDETWQKAKGRAVLYFTKYHNRLLPNPNIWKDLFPVPVQAKHDKGVTHIRELLQPRMMWYLTMALDEDIAMSRKTPSKP